MCAHACLDLCQFPVCLKRVLVAVGCWRSCARRQLGQRPIPAKPRITPIRKVHTRARPRSAAQGRAPSLKAVAGRGPINFAVCHRALARKAARRRSKPRAPAYAAHSRARRSTPCRAAHRRARPLAAVQRRAPPLNAAQLRPSARPAAWPPGGAFHSKKAALQHHSEITTRRTSRTTQIDQIARSKVAFAGRIDLIARNEIDLGGTTSPCCV